MFKWERFSVKQRKVLNWWSSESPVNNKNGIIADGAIRSGKTLCMSVSYVMWAMNAFDGYNFAICGKTQGSIRRNVLNTLKVALAGRGYIVEEHRGYNLWNVSKDGKQNTFYMFGGSDESSQDLVQGITLAGAFFDEVALMPESFVNQTTARCSVKGSKWWFNCNPSTPYHWFKQNWINEREEKRILYIHFDLEDNLSLDDEIKSRYYKMYKGVFYQRYILGQWVAAEGIVYDMFDENIHVTNEQIEPSKDVYVSCDYGTQNATVFLMWTKTCGKWICIKEYYYCGRDKLRQKTDSEYAEDMKQWLDNVEPKRIVVDPSAASFIAELRKKGYRVKKGDNEVLDGIRYTSTMLENEKIAISSCCENTIKEFRSYMWDSKAAQRGEDRPLKEHDHCMDAMRYFTYTILRQEKVKVKGFKEGI